MNMQNYFKQAKIISQDGRESSFPDKTIYILEDDKSIRNFMTDLLKSSNYKVKTYQSAIEFLNDSPPVQCGCLISDIVMPGMTGLEMLKALEAKGITLPIIFISGYGNIPIVKQAMKWGAVDFLEKPLDSVEVLNAVRSALEIDAENESKKRKIDNLNSKLSKLTPREKEVLGLLISGSSNKVIAFDLELSLRTVEAHRQKIFKKMAVNSLTEIQAELLRFNISPISQSSDIR